MPALPAYSRTKCHTAFAVRPSPQAFPFFLTCRNGLPAVSLAPWFTGATHTTEEFPCLNARALYPFVQLAMDPIRNGNRPNVTGLTVEVHDCPMPFLLLQVIKRQFGDLVASESASKQEGEQRTIAFALEPFPVWGSPVASSATGRSCDQRLSLRVRVARHPGASRRSTSPIWRLHVHFELHGSCNRPIAKRIYTPGPE